MKTLGVGAIVWHDAVSYSSQYDVDSTPHKPILMTSVGLILSSDKTGVSFCREISGDADVRGVMFIPRGMIKKEIVFCKDFIRHNVGSLQVNLGKSK